MQSTQRTLSRILLSVAMLAALVACKQSAPLATSGTADTAAAPDEVTASEAAKQVAAADAAMMAAPTVETAITPVAAVPVVADPAAKDAVITAIAKLKELRSYRMTFTHNDGPAGPHSSMLEYVAPDRYRMEATGAPSRIVIGDVLYTTNEAGTKAGAVPADSIATWRDPDGFIAAGNDFTAEKGAQRFVFSVPATGYKLHVTKPVASNMNLWIGPKGLPIKLERQGQIGDKLVTTVIKYSHFDSAEIKIDQPK